MGSLISCGQMILYCTMVSAVCTLPGLRGLFLLMMYQLSPFELVPYSEISRMGTCCSHLVNFSMNASDSFTPACTCAVPCWGGRGRSLLAPARSLLLQSIGLPHLGVALLLDATASLSFQASCINSSVTCNLLDMFTSISPVPP